MLLMTHDSMTLLVTKGVNKESCKDYEYGDVNMSICQIYGLSV